MVGLGGVYVYMLVWCGVIGFVICCGLVCFNLVLFCVFYISYVLVCAILFSCCLQLYTLYT